MRTPNLRWLETPSADVALGNEINFAIQPAVALELPLEARDAGDAAAPPAFVIDPPMALRDEMIFLLHIAAEVEHALLVQYLYAAFSIRLSDFPDGAPADAEILAARWYAAIFQTAKEEMGHLLTVQNILNYIGGPLTLDREDFPFRSDFYPFHFRLQPIRRKSLAKYVAAERPEPVEGLTDEERADLNALLKLVDGDEMVNRVGRVYDRLVQLAQQFTPADVRTDRDRFQHEANSWRSPNPATFIKMENGQVIDVGEGVIVYPIHNLQDLLNALKAVAVQGEGTAGASPSNRASHFRRFFDIYRAFPDDSQAPSWPTLPVAVNPNTTPKPAAAGGPNDADLAQGRITNQQAFYWAKLFDHRYRMLLACVLHSLTTDPAKPDGTISLDNRKLLINWAFGEMGSIGSLALILNSLDRTDISGEGKAGATFDLPYTLTLPSDEQDRWRVQRDLLIDATSIYDKITDIDETIENMRASDGADDTQGRRKKIAEILGTSTAPPAPRPSGTPGFAADIKPLFRPVDIAHMKPFGVLLDDYAYMSVAENANLVFERLADRSMPPGGPVWSQSQLDLMQKWIDDGLKP